MLKMILCVDEKYGLAKNNKLAWNIKEEMEHFKKTTLNKIVVMGHNTFKSMNCKLLPRRKNIIFSNNPDLKIKNALVTNNVQYVLKLAKSKDVFIIGGKQIYELFIKNCDEVILSKLHKDYKCDFFYKPNLKFFKLKKIENHQEFDIYFYQSFYHKILDGNRVQEHILNNLLMEKEEIKIKPTLAIVQVGDDNASNLYIKNKIALANKINIETKLFKLEDKITQKQLNNLIEKLNNDKKINGVLVQSPLTNNLNINEVSSLINPLKDVDCFNPINAGLLFRGNFEQAKTLPCTPAGIIEMLKFYNINLKGKNVVVIGRSNIVTKPLAIMLLKKDATVTICHSKTKNINKILKNADIICSGASTINLINSKNIKNNVILIDISINKDDKNRLVGDVDFDNVISKVKYISPVPGGVGPLTLVMLFKNLVNLTKFQLKDKNLI